MSKGVFEERYGPSNNLLGDIRNYSRQIWLAGLGIYAKAGQSGVDYFKELVQYGEELEHKGRDLVSEQVDSVEGSLTPVKHGFEGIKERVEDQFEKIETSFDNRVARALNRMGFPSRQDVDRLSTKLDVLNSMLITADKTK
jgi:poly(hydroxyalkanoate) granule-associated protein